MSMDSLCRRLTDGEIDRRRFMQIAIAMGLSAGAASAFAGRALAAKPNKGGTLRVGVGAGSTADSLDPSLAGDPFTIPLVFGYCNYLTEITNEGKLVPELAESWEASDDAVQWVFKLRKGIEFHNGKTLEAEDIVANVNYHRSDDSQSKIKTIVKKVADVRADGKDTVVFTLESGNADFPYIVSDYHLGILPSKDGAIDGAVGIGTGPYRLTKFDPGVNAEFERNENYWKAGRAHFDAVNLLAIIDPTARTNALTTGSIDVMDRVDLKTAHLLIRNKDLVVEEVTGTQHYTLPMRCDTAPFDDVNVRLALKLAVDREELVKKILRGHGSVGNDHPISPANQYFAKDLPQRAYDPEKAKFHLKKAGHDSLKVQLSAADAAFAGAVDTAVLFSEHAKKAGIQIDVIREPGDGYWESVWMKKPWTASYWGGRPTEDWMFSTAYDSNAPWNESFWKNDRFDRLLAAARVELNSDKRREMYFEMQQLVRDDGGSVIPMFANYVWATSTKIEHDPKVASNWDLDGSKFMERWWFKA